MGIAFLMKFTEIFLSSAELCYFDRNKKMKPSRIMLTFILTIKSSWKTTVDVSYLDFEHCSQLFQLPWGNIFSRGILEEDAH